MKRILSLCLLLTVLLLPGISSAQALNADNILSSLSEHFINEVRLTAEPIKQAATRLFFLLLPIAIVLQGLKLIFRSGNYMSFSLEMVKLTLITGIYLFLLNNGETIGISIVDSLCSIVSSEKQGPSELIDLIFNITGRISCSHPLLCYIHWSLCTLYYRCHCSWIWRIQQNKDLCCKLSENGYIPCTLSYDLQCYIQGNYILTGENNVIL